MNEVKRRRKLFFSTSSYPTFGRGLYNAECPPTRVLKSPYYWWFKFLQLNEEYKATVRGELDTHKEVFADFGDVSDIDFKSWWSEKAWLFAEQRTRYGMRIAESLSDLAPFGDEEAINLVVPLTWSRKSLLKKFREEVLSLVPEHQKGVQVAGSTATYKLARWNVGALESAHRVYVIRQVQPQLAWADVALLAELKIAGMEGMRQKDKRAQYKDVRRVATTVAMRYHRYAIGYIKAAVSKTFPGDARD